MPYNKSLQLSAWVVISQDVMSFEAGVGAWTMIRGGN